MLREIAPRIVLYPFGSTPPSQEPDGLALPRLPQSAEYAAVFGDGSHTPTRLCAGALNVLCRQRRPKAVLDMGTGTGILARIARARGVAFIVETDIDSTARTFARAQYALDEHPIEIHLGSGAAQWVYAAAGACAAEGS